MAATVGHPFDNPNAATIHAIDQARCRLIEAELDERKCMERLVRAYAAVKDANAEISGAIADLTRLQHALGDTELAEREVHRVGELTVSVQGHPSRLSDALKDAVRSSRQDRKEASA